MTATFGTSVSKVFVPAHVPSLPALDNDTLGCAIEWRLAEARSHPEWDPPFRAADILARVCTRLRRLMLRRLSYWRDVHVCEQTKVDEVKLILARAGADFPVDIHLEWKKQLGPFSPRNQILDNSDAYLQAYTALHRARAIMITRYVFTRHPPKITSDLVQPAHYDSRPLVHLSLVAFFSDVLLQLVGPRLTRLDIYEIKQSISLDRLEQVMVAASGLTRLTLQEINFASTPNTGEHTLGVPSAALTRDRVRCLSHLLLADLSHGAGVTNLICRHYPLTRTESPSVVLSLQSSMRETDHFAVWVDLEALGSPTHILLDDDVAKWELYFAGNRKRGVKASISRLGQLSLLQGVLRSALAVTPSLEVRDDGNVPSAPWFKFWCGSTWGQVTRLHIRLEHADRYRAEYYIWRPHEEQRIQLPALQTLVLMTLRFDNFTKCGFQCAAILDMLEIPSTNIIEIHCARSNVDYLKKAIDVAYLGRHGCAYFSEVDN